MPDPAHYQKAREAAFRLLAYRARSAQELSQRLRQKGFHPSIIDQVLTDLQAGGYQSDLEFARQYVSEKWSASGWGPSRIGQGLRQKGIEAELARQVLDELFRDRDLVGGLLPLARKRWRLTSDLPLEVRRRRLIGYLQRRGYDWETIGQVIGSMEGSEGV